HEMLKAEAEQAEETYRRVHRLAAATPTLTNDESIIPARQTTKIVRQSGMDVLGENDPESSLTTKDVGPCVVAIFHNPAERTVALTHLDGWHAIHHLESMRQQ